MGLNWAPLKLDGYSKWPKTCSSPRNNCESLQFSSSLRWYLDPSLCQSSPAEDQAAVSALHRRPENRRPHSTALRILPGKPPGRKSTSKLKLLKPAILWCLPACLPHLENKTRWTLRVTAVVNLRKILNSRRAASCSWVFSLASTKVKGVSSPTVTWGQSPSAKSFTVIPRANQSRAFFLGATVYPQKKKVVFPVGVFPKKNKESQ